MADAFVRLSDVFDGEWKFGESVCAECSHPGDRHDGKAHACRVRACECREFALWKGDKPGAKVRRFGALLAALGPEGEAARSLWSKARPSARVFVEDRPTKEQAEWAELLVELSAKPEAGSAAGLAVVVVWSSEESERYVWTLVHGEECPAGEVLRGLWAAGPVGVGHG